MGYALGRQRHHGSREAVATELPGRLKATSLLQARASLKAGDCRAGVRCSTLVVSPYRDPDFRREGIEHGDRGAAIDGTVHADTGGVERQEGAGRDAQVLLRDIGRDDGAGRIAGAAKFDLDASIAIRGEQQSVLVEPAAVAPGHHHWG